jgi:hypothetical protein
MIFKVDKDHEPIELFLKNTSACRVVIINPSRIVDLAACHIDPSLLQPFFVL